MSTAKKYFYLKLKDNFFDTDEMIVLESMPDGYKYSNILLKLYLRSVKHEGRLMFNERIPFNSTMLSNVTRHSVGDIEKAVQIFKDLNLIEVLDNGAIYMLDIQNFIGKSSTEADRIREYRTKLNDEKKQLIVQSSYICTPELEIELDLELKKEIELDKDTMSGKPSVVYENNHESVVIEEAIKYLNEKAGTSYRASTPKTRKLIQARVKEGFNLNDFYAVIDKKVMLWKDDIKMQSYLRPETLFGTKFESYLNEIVSKGKALASAGIISESTAKGFNVLEEWGN